MDWNRPGVFDTVWAVLIAVLGGFYVGVALARAVVGLDGDIHTATLLIETLYVAGPGLALVYFSYWLGNSDIRPRYHVNVFGWCLTGLVVIGLMLLVYDLRPGAEVDDPLTAVPVLTALGAVAGFAIGVNVARAVQLQEIQAELEETIDKLEASNERLEQFAYAASHDLVEPLRMVSSYLQLLERRHGDELDGDAAEFLQFANDGAERMMSMIDGLLEYARVESRGGAFEAVDLGAVIDDVRRDLSVRIDESDATITTDDLPTVRGDPDQLRYVFQTLFENAITYSGEAPPRITVTSRRTDGGWRVTVADEGIGIRQDEQNHVFELFQRGEASVDTDGTGVGLATTERIVERHGGTIDLESTPGEGSAFSFTLQAWSGSDG